MPFILKERRMSKEEFLGMENVRKKFCVAETIMSLLIVIWVSYQLKSFDNDLVKLGVIYLFIRNNLFYRCKE